MRKTKVILGLLILLLAGLLLAGPVLAARALAADGSAIPRHVIGGGGQRATGGDYILNGTVGEPIASGFTQGAVYGHIAGFWWPEGGAYAIYLPLVMR